MCELGSLKRKSEVTLEGIRTCPEHLALYHTITLQQHKPQLKNIKTGVSDTAEVTRKAAAKSLAAGLCRLPFLFHSLLKPELPCGVPAWSVSCLLLYDQKV